MIKKIHQKKVGIFLLILVDCFLALIVAELWIRFFVPVMNINYFVDDIIGVRYSPNQKMYGHVQEGYSNWTTTNSIGFHDIERSKKAESGEYRIQMYGDSMVAGLGVQINQTIPSYLNRYLNRSRSKKIEVLNMAAGTESTAGQYLTYENIGKEYDANMIILVFMADFYDNTYALSKKKHHPFYNLSSGGNLVYQPPVPKATDTITANFKRKWCHTYRLLANKFLTSEFYAQCKELYKYIKYALSNIFFKKTKISESIYQKSIDEIYINKSWPVTLKIIEKFKIEVEKKGIKFILADAGTFQEPINKYFTNKDLELFCNEKNITYVPLYQTIEEMFESNQNSQLFLDDGHPNNNGNKKISSFLAENIQEII